MLRNVLADYLNALRNERDFDAPFMALLSAMGFYDIHYTHGQGEFGKDFIAKHDENNETVQYIFQLKCGDISQADWRNNLMGQVLEGATNSLSHPHLDTALNQQFVIVTTGRLSNNAALGMQDLNTKTLSRLKKRPVVAWEQPQLIDNLAKYGQEGIHRATAAVYESYGDFYSIYGLAMQNKVTARRIESYSRRWLNDQIELKQRILIATIETEVISGQCKLNNAMYESVFSYLCLSRAMLHAIFSTKDDPDQNAELINLYDQVKISIIQSLKQYISSVTESWNQCGRNLLELITGYAQIVTYPIHCARIMEMGGLLYFLTNDPKESSELANFMNDFVDVEVGCQHPIGDFYAVSLVPTTLALIRGGFEQSAQNLLHKTTVWICDRYLDGYGLARIEASPNDEVAQLLGYPFSNIDVFKQTSSFMATVLCDLAAKVGNAILYSDIVNDILACEIDFNYWQVCDTLGQFSIEGEDVIQYPNIEFDSNLSKGLSGYAEHIRCEPASFKILDCVDSSDYMILTLVLRDRYFPTVWSDLLKSN